MNTQEQNTMYNETTKEVYEKPSIEIIEMEHEGSILQASGNGFDDGSGGWV